MPQLNLHPLPYTAPDPPADLFCCVETASGRSSTTAFNRALDDRDVFLGRRRCVICGEVDALQRCYIVGRSDDEKWKLLKRLGWAPLGVKYSPEHESRNGLTMCANHHMAFNNWRFFIHFEPDIKKYIFVLYDSYDMSPYLQQFHGKAVALDPKDKSSPLPLLLLTHEYMVRGRNFYQPTPNVEITHDWQDWMVRDGVVKEEGEGSFTFNRSAPTSGHPAGQTTNLQGAPPAVPSSGSQIHLTPLTPAYVEELMAFQRTMPSWKEWQKESMSWGGTAEENVERYVASVGVESTPEE